MDIVLILTVLGTGVTIIGTVYTFVRNFKADMKADIIRLHEDHQNAILRIDHLYKVIIDMLKKDTKK